MCMKQNWDQTSGFFDFKKAITTADGIRHTFTLQRGVNAPRPMGSYNLSFNQRCAS